MTILLLFTQVHLAQADTADIEDSDGTILNLSSGAITTGDSGNVGLTSGVVPGNTDHGIYILNSKNTQLSLSGTASISTYGYQANAVNIEGNNSNSSQYLNNSITMSAGTIITEGSNSIGFYSEYGDQTTINFSGGSITTGDAANIGLTNSVNYGEESHGIHIYRSSDNNINISGSAAITAYGYDANAVYIEGNNTDTSRDSDNTVTMTGGTIITKGYNSNGLYSEYSDDLTLNISGGSITTGDAANIGLTNSVNYGEESHAIYNYRSNDNNINLSGTASLNTYGYESSAVYIVGHNSDPSLYTNSTINMTGGSITTQGIRSKGFHSEFSDNITINFSGGSITTGDAANIGLTASVNYGENADAIHLYRGSNSSVDISSSAQITTYGYSARGIAIEGTSSDSSLYSNNSINMTGGSITTQGYYSRAIYSNYADNTAVTMSGGSITTGDVANIGEGSTVYYGKNGDGIHLYRGNNSSVDLSSTAQITTFGYAARGIFIEADNSDSSRYSNNTINMTGGSITTQGVYSRGIYSYHSDNTVVTMSGGSITTGDIAHIGLNTSINHGKSAAGIYLYRGSNASVDISSTAQITTYGHSGQGIHIDGHSSDTSLYTNNTITMTGGSISTNGYNSNGIYSDYSDSTSITISGGSITTGDVANIGINSTVDYGKFSEAIILSRSDNSTIDISGTAQLTTYGYSAIGVRLQEATNTTLSLSGNSSIITHGSNSHGIDLNNSGDNNTINLSGTTNITVNDGRGIWVYGGTSNTVINLSDSASIVASTQTIYAHNTDATNTTLNLIGANWSLTGLSGTMNGVINEDVADTSDNIRNINNLGVTAGATISANQDFTGQGAISNDLTLGAATAGSSINTVLTSGAIVDTGTGNDTLTLINIDDNTTEIGATGSTESLRGFDNIYLDNSNLTGNLDLDTIADEADNKVSLANDSSISGYIDAGVGDTDTLIIGVGQTLDSSDIHLEGGGVAAGEKYRNFETMENYGTLTGAVIFNSGDNILTIGAGAAVGTVDFGETGETNGDTLVLGTAGAFSALKINTDIGSGLSYLNLEQVLGDSNAQEWTVTANDVSLDSIDLAAGSDTLIINNGTTVAFSNISPSGLYRGIDNLIIDGTITGNIDLSSTDSGNSTITIGATATIGDILTGNGDDTLNVADGVTLNNIDLGSGNNIFNFNGTVSINGNLPAANSTINLDSNALTVNGITDLSGATVNVTVNSDGSSGSISSSTIIINGGNLNLSVGSGFSPGDLVDKDLNTILVSNDIQNGSGGQVVNRYSGFDSFTHSPLLRVYDDGTLAYEGFAAGTSEASVASALDANDAILDDVVISNFISTATTSELEEFVEETRPQTAMEVETINLAVDTAVTSINNRFSTLGISFTPTSSGDQENSTDDSFWIEALYSKIDKETTSSAIGYNSSVSGTSIGYDQSLNGLTLGAAYSFYSGRSTNSNGYIESEIHQLSFYGMKEFQNFYLKGVLGGGLANNDSVRRISTVSLEADASYRSLNYYMDLELGKNYDFQNFHFTPYIGAKFTHVESEDYKEKGAGILNLSMDNENTDSFEGIVGARLAKNFLINDENFITTHLGFAISKEFGNANQSTTGRFSNGQVNFNSTKMDVEKYHYNCNAGLTWVINEKLEVKFNYLLRTANNYLEQVTTLDLTISF